MTAKSTLLSAAQRRLRSLRDPAKARVLQRFFKTGPGEYGEGDEFLGIVVPKLRALAGEFAGLDIPSVGALLDSPVHEERLLALLVLVRRYEKAEPPERETIHRFYLRRRGRVNNWDLVDLSAPCLVGRHVLRTDGRLLHRLAGSAVLWDRRIAVVSTLAFIREGRFAETLAIAERLLGDREDLIHKAAGWMLREVGKRDRVALERFLDSHAAVMPRTMLRYAIERLPDEKRQAYMAMGTPRAARPHRVRG